VKRILLFIVVLLLGLGLFMYTKTLGAINYITDESLVDSVNYTNLDKYLMPIENSDTLETIKITESFVLDKPDKPDKISIEPIIDLTLENEISKITIEESKYAIKLKELKSILNLKQEKRDDLVNIVLLGLDSRNLGDTKTSRSDAIIILTLDKLQKEIRLTSIPRDLLILRGNKLDKLTHVYLYGGATTIQVLNDNLDLNITDFIAIDMFNLSKVLSIFGDFQVSLSEVEKDELNYRIKEYAGIVIGDDEHYLNVSDVDFQKEQGNLVQTYGSVNLNGIQTLAYLRMRKLDGVYARSTRHREILTQLFSKQKDLSLLSYFKLVNELFPRVSTSLSQEEIIGLLTNYVGVLSNMNIKSENFPKVSNLDSIYLNRIYYTDIKDRVSALKNLNLFIESSNSN